MITKRLVVVFLVILLGLSSVFLLPKAPAEQPTGIALELPKFVGGWYGEDLAITQREVEVLGSETEFSRKAYRNGRGDEIMVSIVLSGHDMNTSIHRPERCLPAQGWTIADKQSLSIPIPGRGILPLTRLHNLRPINDEHGKFLATSFNLNYYWFVGYTGVTGSHYSRTATDVMDRLLKGYNQRWAYVTVAANITDGYKRDGLTEQQTDQVIREFIKQLVPKTFKESVKLDS